MVCSLPGSSAHGISQARILEWVAFSFYRGSSWPRDWTQISCIAGILFTNCHQGSPPGKTSFNVTKELYKPAKCVDMRVWFQIVLRRSHKLVAYRNYKHAFIGLHTVYTLDNFCPIAVIYSHFTYFHNLMSHYNLVTWASWSKMYKINLETLHHKFGKGAFGIFSNIFYIDYTAKYLFSENKVTNNHRYLIFIMVLILLMKS